MPFHPKNDRHAIIEVVFIINLSRSLELSEVNSIEAAHEKWKSDLPSKTRSSTIQLIFDNQPLPSGANFSPPPGGIIFKAFKRDGNIDWQMRVESSSVVVNCLTYTRWTEIWARARSLMKLVFENINLSLNPGVGAALQYIDQFEWDGAVSTYALDQLLRRDSNFIPSAIWDKGPLWHLDQGWFRQEGPPVAGRLLERMALNGLEAPQGAYGVRMDNTLRLDFGQAVASHEAMFGGTEPLIDRIFGWLHIRNKSLVKSYITDEVAQRIGLNA